MRLSPLAALTAALLLIPAAAAGPFVTTPDPVHDGTRAAIDLPVAQHMRNTGGMGRGGPGTGAGLCVFTSIELDARWSNVATLAGLQRWMTTREGGGYPSKVDAVLRAFCAERGLPVPEYVQHTGGDLAFLDLVVRTGRCAGVTYSGSDGFYSGRVAHMVNLAHLDEKRAAVIDNNRPGQWVWMSRGDFAARWRDMNGGWAFVLLAPPPPANPAVSAEPFAACPCPCPGGCACSGPCECPGPPSFGQCSGGSCRVPPASVQPLPPPPEAPAGEAPAGLTPPSPRHYWGRFADGRAGWRLRAEADQVGAELPTGVMSDRVHESPRYSINGQPATVEQARAALTDDSAKWHLAAVGDEAFRAKVAGDVAALPAELRGKLHVQLYAPDAWPVGAYQLGAGVTLRAPGRAGAHLATVAPAAYAPGSLLDLLGHPRGPQPKPGPAPTPAPGPTPEPSPTPSPAGGSVPWLLLAVAAALVLFRRR